MRQNLRSESWAASASIDIQAFLDEHKFSAYQWLIFAMCFSIMLLDGFDTTAIGYIAPSLLKEWGLNRSDLAPVLSAALVGLAVGALLAGPLADVLGRKAILTASVAFFGAACLSSAFADSLWELTLMRFMTGIGLGAAMPNAVTLISEYCPTQRRAVLTNAVFSGFPLGAAFGGFLASWMIPHFGWRSVLMLGGIVPLGLVVIQLFLLPESARYMVARKHDVARIQAVLSRIAGQAITATRFTLIEVGATASGKAGLSLILSRSYLLGSIMLWIAYFMGLVIFYALVNWMPLLLKDAGIDAQSATLIAALFPLGGVGAVLFGWLMDRFNGSRLIALCYLLTAASVFAIGQATGKGLGVLVVAVFIAGTLTSTAQASLPALAASFYPTAGRATGVAWMLGIGRFGGIAGSFLIAELTRQKLGIDIIFMVVAIPAVLAATALLIKQATRSEGLSEPRAAAERLATH